MPVSVDHLVIGAGLAGLNAALLLAERGDSVMVVSKRTLGHSNTAWAQGGLACVMAEEDSFTAHVDDTLEAGAGLCDREAVETIVAAGPDAVERLVELGVEFDRDSAAGLWDLTREGGHSQRRVLHSKDFTGREIDRALCERVRAHVGIDLCEDHIAIDLRTEKDISLAGARRCVGAYILDKKTGLVLTVRARATLLATGGAGKVYLYTSNPDVSTGDGIAMAFRAGARVANMEFFQFHPTCLFHPEAKSLLVSEALRGEGGVLRRRDGARLMEGVHEMADLAPRDIVARAIDRDLKRTGEDCAYLDMSARDADYLRGRFPNIHQALLGFGIDMTTGPIPVVPAAHYMCGGVDTDLRGRSSVLGLWVAGESACTGLHGANRLASNSLLEAAVVSGHAAVDMAAYARDVDHGAALPEWDPGGAVHPDEMVVVSHNWDELRRTMWNYVGIVRSDKRLERAEKRIGMLRDEIDEYYWSFLVTSDLIELRNLVDVAQLIIAAARQRRESRGLHFNIDCPDSDVGQRRSIFAQRGGRGSIVWHTSGSIA